MTLANSHVVIVGGTKGIGRATAIAALSAGARVTATGGSAQSLATLPAGVTGLQLDFTDPDSVATMAAQVPALDHLVLSASDAVAWGPFADLAETALRAGFDAKFWGYWRLVRAPAPSALGTGRRRPLGLRTPSGLDENSERQKYATGPVQRGCPVRPQVTIV